MSSFTTPKVIVVGGGLSGLSAAHTVLQNGGRVLVLDKKAFMGGNSTKATSGINGCLTKTQVRLGIQDSVEAFTRDTALSASKGADATPYPLAEVLCGESGPAVEWLIERFGLDLSLVSQLGGHSFQRTHRGKERFPGMTITYALMEKLEEISAQSPHLAQVLVRARVTDFIRDPNTGAVTGVKFVKDGQTFTEHGPVIVATGGYGADFTGNTSLLARHRPDLANYATTNGDHCTGDGIKMSEAIGAGTVDMQYVQVHPTGLVNPKEPDAKVKFLAAEALRGVGGLLLTGDGQRFVDELGRRDYVSGEMQKNKGPFRLVLNGAASREIEWHCKHYTGRGLMQRVEGGDNLAKLFGVSPSQIKDTFEKYNECARTKKCPFGKKFFRNAPWKMDDYFYVGIVTPIVHYTMGGLHIDTDARVMDGANGKPIPGLYATGEVCGGVHGKNRLGGSSLLDCVVFGRVSGRTVCRDMFSQLLESGGAGGAAGNPAQHGITVSVDPRTHKVQVTIGGGGGAAAAPAAAPAAPASRAAPAPAPVAAAAPAAAPANRTFTPQEVAEHNTEGDCWVIVGDQVLDVTSFLNDHPGGKGAIMLFAGKDATEEFDMLHERNVISKYAPQCVIGTVVKGGEPVSAAPSGGATIIGSAGAKHAARNSGVTNDFSKPNNTIALHPLQMPEPSNVPSRNSGGTADELPKERAKATFDSLKMTHVLDGGEEQTKRRRFILSPLKNTDASDKYFMDRHEQLAKHIEHFFGIHDAFVGYRPTRSEVAWMSEFGVHQGTMMNHFGLFLLTLLGQASDEMLGHYLLRAATSQIIGAYAQTELGHGSNVRGIATTAEYDKSTEQFVINTPTLTAMKWWPGTVGKVCTHAAVYAQLIIDGKEYGVHPFMVQVRDENHRPLPGIELGDLGPKMGDGANDTGFMRFENVRIAREAMFSKWQHVTKDGRYVKNAKKTNDKMHYATMMFTRGGMVRTAGGKLSIGVTIAIRYSCVRRQGFKDTRKGVSHRSEEHKVIDYQMQRYRLFKQLALAYAMKFTGVWMTDQFGKLGSAPGMIEDTSALPEIAATSAGLKALCTYLTTEGLEDCRKCCGGNGYLLSSGIAALSLDYLWQLTAEGEATVLSLQTARFLLKCLNRARDGEQLHGPVSYLNDRKAPPPPQASSKADFYDLDYLTSLFRYRALRAVLDADERVQRDLDAGQTLDDARTNHGYHLVYAATVHGMYFILDTFAKQVRWQKEQDIKAVLEQLCVFFAITGLQEDNWAGLEVFGPRQMKMVKDVAEELLDALRPNAIALTDAFDIPDAVMSISALGHADGNVYERLYESALKSTLNQVDPFIGYEEHLRPRLDMDFLKLRNGKIDSML